MRKLAALRAAVLAAPLGIKAKDVLTFAEKGTVRSWRGEGHGFVLAYTAHVIVTGYAGAPQDLLFVALTWLHGECVDATPEEAIRFHVDIIDHKSADVSLAIEVSEIIAGQTSVDGLRLVPASDPDAHGFDMGDLEPGLPETP